MLDTKSTVRMANALLAFGTENEGVLDFGKGTFGATGKTFKLMVRTQPDKQSNVRVRVNSRALRAIGKAKAAVVKSVGEKEAVIETAKSKWTFPLADKTSMVFDNTMPLNQITVDAKQLKDWMRLKRKLKYKRVGVWQGMFFRFTPEAFYVAYGFPNILNVHKLPYDGMTNNTWWLPRQAVNALYQLAQLMKGEARLTFRKSSIIVEASNIKVEFKAWIENGIKIEDLFQKCYFLETDMDFIRDMLTATYSFGCFEVFTDGKDLLAHRTNKEFYLGSYPSGYHAQVRIVKANMIKVMNLLHHLKVEKVGIGIYDNILAVKTDRSVLFIKDDKRRCEDV